MMFDTSEQGQGLTEYALLIMLIALVLIAIVALLGSQISNIYSKIVTSWPP